MPNSKIQKLEKELEKEKLRQLSIDLKKAEDETLSFLQGMVGKCYMKPTSRSNTILFKVVGVDHKLYSQGGKLLKVSLKTERIVTLRIEDKDYRKSGAYFRSNLINNEFQNSKYLNLEETQFQLRYNEDGLFNFRRSVSYFTMGQKEISEEAYQKAVKIATDNERQAEEFYQKYIANNNV